MKFVNNLFYVLFIVGCGNSYTKPVNVSTSAFFLGGIDGGVWIDTATVNSNCLSIVAIWASGDTAGMFNYQIPDSMNSKSIVDDMSGFDGNNILFIKNEYFSCR